MRRTGRALTPKRTEYGKQIRKAYEGGYLKERRVNIQKLEPRSDGICNTLTTVQKDNLILGKVVRMEGIETFDEPEEVGKNLEDYLYTAKNGEQYAIFKLSPRECLRLMDVGDDDIDKMLKTNSWSQCYKQAGNSIVVAVLSAIFSQLHIQGITPWNERTHEERMMLLGFKHREE